MLTIEKLAAGYKNKPILDEISLKVAQGAVVALIGPNGSGKTTLIRAISGVIPLKSGSMYYDHINLADMSVQERAKHIAVVPQTRTLPPAFSVREAVALGRTPYLNWLGQLSESDEQIILNALFQTNLIQLADHNIAELSGGEQQRVLLARALAQETPVLLMDEPTAHLDLQYQISFLETVKRLAHPTDMELEKGAIKRAVLIAIHDLNLLYRYADIVVLLVGGKLTAVGTPAEVLNSAVLSEAYQLPLTILKDSASDLSAILPSQCSNRL